MAFLFWNAFICCWICSTELCNEEISCWRCCWIGAVSSCHTEIDDFVSSKTAGTATFTSLLILLMEFLIFVTWWLKSFTCSFTIFLPVFIVERNSFPDCGVVSNTAAALPNRPVKSE